MSNQGKVFALLLSIRKDKYLEKGMKKGKSQLAEEYRIENKHVKNCPVSLKINVH